MQLFRAENAHEQVRAEDYYIFHAWQDGELEVYVKMSKVDEKNA